MLPKLAFEKMKIRTASLGEQSSIPDLLGEVIQQNRLEFRLDEDDEIYERYGRGSFPRKKYRQLF